MVFTLPNSATIKNHQAFRLDGFSIDCYCQSNVINYSLSAAFLPRRPKAPPKRLLKLATRPSLEALR